MVDPAGRVFRLYWPVFCRATPQAERAPVQLFSVAGFAFWASGSGWLVEVLQSALPAVSALLLSNRTRCGAAAAAAGRVVVAEDVVAEEAGAARPVRVAASRAEAARADLPRMFRIAVICRSSVGCWGCAGWG